MKINQSDGLTGVQVVVGQGEQMGIDTSNLMFVYSILTKGFYSNPVHAVLREYASNAWDANVEAGKADKPIHIVTRQTDTEAYIEFQDSGPGFSEERMDTVFKKFFASTKRDTDSLIGAMGLGSKSAFAIVNEFFIYTVHEGTLYTYLMSKDEVGIPSMYQLSKEPTDNPNGTAVRIYVNQGLLHKFHNEAATALTFFPNIYFDFCKPQNWADNRKVYIGKNLVVTNTFNTQGAYIVYGNCYYPLDYDKFPNSGVLKNVPIGIRLNIGEAAPIPSREALIYDDKTTAIISQRIKDAFDELVGLYNNVVKTKRTLKEWFDLKASSNKMFFINSDALLPFPVSSVKLIDSSVPDIEYFEPFEKLYKTEGIDRYNVLYLKRVACYIFGKWKFGFDQNQQTDFRTVLHGKVLALRGDEYINPTLFMDRVKLAYAARMGYVEIVRLQKPSLKTYADILKFTPVKFLWINKKYVDVPLRHSMFSLKVDKWREQIKIFQNFYMKQWSEIPSFHDLQVDEEFIDSMKVKPARKKLEDGEINYRYAEHKYFGEVTFKNASCKFSELIRYNYRNKIIIYASDPSELRPFAGLVSKSKAGLIVCAKVYHKLFKENDKCYTVEEFKKTKYWQQCVTAAMVQLLLIRYNYLLDNAEPINDLLRSVPGINIKLGYKSTRYATVTDRYENDPDFIRDLRVYAHKHNIFDVTSNKMFIDSIISHMLSNKLQDYSIFDIYKNSEILFDFFSDLNYLRTNGSYTNRLDWPVVREFAINYFKGKIQNYDKTAAYQIQFSVADNTGGEDVLQDHNS